MASTTGERDSPPPPYNAVTNVLRLPPRRSNQDSRKIRRMQFLLVIGNWICILAFVAAAILILVPVFDEHLNSAFEATIRVLGYCLMGIIVLTILFLNCVVRRMVFHESMRFGQRQRRRVVSTINEARQSGQPVSTAAANVVDTDSGHPSAYLGPYGLNDKNEPYGLPSYESAIGENPPPYYPDGSSDPSCSHNPPPNAPNIFTLNS